MQVATAHRQDPVFTGAQYCETSHILLPPQLLPKHRHARYMLPDFFSWTKDAMNGTARPTPMKPKKTIPKGIRLLCTLNGRLLYTPSLKWTACLLVAAKPCLPETEKALLVDSCTRDCLNIVISDFCELCVSARTPQPLQNRPDTGPKAPGAQTARPYIQTPAPAPENTGAPARARLRKARTTAPSGR